MTEAELHRRSSLLSVLYVEDSTTIRRATAKLLNSYFPSLETASDGVEAFEIYRRFHAKNDKNYDIVITDLEMPNMDGRELCRLILDIDPDQSIIVISSNESFHDLIGLMNIGVKKFLTKPINGQELHEIIHNVVDAIFHKQIKAQELEDISTHNTLLKKREEIYLKKLEKNLKVLSEFNDALNESGIVSKTDSNGIITYVNDKFCKISGYSVDELIGKSHNIVNGGEFPSSYYEELWHKITRGKSYTGILKNRAKDGTFYFVDILIKPILNTQNEIVEYISISHDMTPLMNALENEHQAQLQKDEFFNNISHEMRTPLNAILGLTSLLKRRTKEDPKLYDMLNVIDESSQNLHHLIESILDIQKLQSGTLELQEQTFEIHPLLNKLFERYQIKANEKEQLFNTTIDPILPIHFIGDGKRLSQVIGTILDNAIKFTPRNGKIDLTLSYQDGNLTCQVDDNGIGIAPEHQQIIFGLTQIDGSATRKHEGAGLGLVIAHQIIELMKGTIILRSQIGQGSTFLLEIPLKVLE